MLGQPQTVDGVLIFSQADLGEGTAEKYGETNHVESKGTSKFVFVVFVTRPDQQSDTA